MAYFLPFLEWLVFFKCWYGWFCLSVRVLLPGNRWFLFMALLCNTNWLLGNRTSGFGSFVLCLMLTWFMFLTWRMPGRVYLVGRKVLAFLRFSFQRLRWLFCGFKARLIKVYNHISLTVVKRLSVDSLFLCLYDQLVFKVPTSFSMVQRSLRISCHSSIVKVVRWKMSHFFQKR